MKIIIKDEDEEDIPYSLDDPLDNSLYNKKQKKNKRQLIEEENTKNTWKNILSHPLGRKEIWKIIDDMRPFQDIFACSPNGSPQVEATWFHAGIKSAGQKLYFKLKRLCPELVDVMHKENDPSFFE